MRAIEVPVIGGPEVLTSVDRPTPEPGAGQVLIKADAVGVNFIDTYFRSGLYPRAVPFVVGTEVCGTIAAVGPDVPVLNVGDRVVTANADGAYAEYCVAPSDFVAYVTVLVHAGAGGVGLILTQWATSLGTKVITTVSSPEKAALSRQAGAVEVLDYPDDPAVFAARIRELTDGQGVQAVYDGVGRTTFDASLASLAVRGTLALFGAASGPVPPVDPQRLNQAGSVFLTRPNLAHFTRSPDEFAWRAGEVIEAIADGSITITVGGHYPLAEAAQAHRDLQGRKTVGSIVLVP